MCLTGNNPALANCGQCITQTIKSGSVNAITSPLGKPDSRTAFSPPLQFNLRARYDWNLFNDYQAFVSAGASHIGGMFNQPASYPTREWLDATLSGHLGARTSISRATPPMMPPWACRRTSGRRPSTART